MTEGTKTSRQSQRVREAHGKRGDSDAHLARDPVVAELDFRLFSMRAKNLYRGLRAAVRAFRIETEPEDDIAQVRRRTKTRPYLAIVSFALFFAWVVLLKGEVLTIVQVEGKSVVTSDQVTVWAILAVAIQSLWVNPSDRLILKLAERIQRLEESATGTAGTSAPEQPRAPIARVARF